MFGYQFSSRIVEKSTRNQSLGYELTFQQLLMKTRTQTYSLLYQDI